MRGRALHCVNHLPLAPDLRGKPACLISLFLDNTFIAYRRGEEMDLDRGEDKRKVERGREQPSGWEIQRKRCKEKLTIGRVRHSRLRWYITDRVHPLSHVQMNVPAPINESPHLECHLTLTTKADQHKRLWKLDFQNKALAVLAANPGAKLLKCKHVTIVLCFSNLYHNKNSRKCLLNPLIIRDLA